MNTESPSELAFQLRIQVDLQAKILTMLKSTDLHSGYIEVNFHADDAAREAHQACQEVSNLNKMFVHEGN